jgi:N-acetyl-gamma-glutamyl-phosphate reductase
MKIGVLGASGYAGAELLRLCAAHGEFEVSAAGAASHAGEAVAAHTPSLGSAYPSFVYSNSDPASFVGLDLVFLALPHGESQRLVPQLVGKVGAIVDLAADFRLVDPEAYPRWYGEAHAAPELLGRFVYGLPELFGAALDGATLVAAPGCYPTAAALALAPLVRAGVVETSGIVVDAASGVSGAGRAPSERLHFGTVSESFTAYGLLTHRHTPEIEQALGAQVLFTPHLAPMARGILATCYARPAAPLDTQGALAILREAYADAPFVSVVDSVPATKDTTGSNSAHVTARVDDRTGWVLSLCALDNLGKGAAGQAVQCANVMSGLRETEGLPLVGVFP